ncbi:MAG: hypothetical protein K6F19_06265 [Oscillospiraceae bacterium]|nr:hypothetical protein [Oscillospiraceae bacterium]
MSDLEKAITEIVEIEKAGPCELCSKPSDQLKIVTFFGPDLRLVWACPGCRKTLEWIRAERGEREAHQS